MARRKKTSSKLPAPTESETPCNPKRPKPTLSEDAQPEDVSGNRVDTEVQPLEIGRGRETTALAKGDNQDHQGQVLNARDAPPGPVETETESGITMFGESQPLVPGAIAKSPFKWLPTELLDKTLKYVCSVVSFMNVSANG
jgi:hypothetical protein